MAVNIGNKEFLSAFPSTAEIGTVVGGAGLPTVDAGVGGPLNDDLLYLMCSASPVGSGVGGWPLRGCFPLMCSGPTDEAGVGGWLLSGSFPLTYSGPTDEAGVGGSRLSLLSRKESSCEHYLISVQSLGIELCGMLGKLTCTGKLSGFGGQLP